jgi:hypothetical protein
VSDYQEQDEAEGAPVDAGHDALGLVAAAAFTFDHGESRMPSVQTAMNAMAGLSGALGGLAARFGADLVGRHPVLGFDAATEAGRKFDFTKLAGVESVSERVSAAAKSWMTSANGAHDGLAAAAFKFDDGVSRMPGVQAAMSAMAGPSLSGILGSGPSGEDLIGRFPGLDAARGFPKLSGMPTDLESVSERVSAAAKSWMTSANGAHGGLAAAAFKFDDGVSRMPGVQAAMNAMAGPSFSGILGSGPSGEDLIGRFPGLDAARGFGFTKLAGIDPHGVTGGLVAAAAAVLKFDDGVSRTPGVQATMNAMAGPSLSGLLGGDHAARFGMSWANGELGRPLNGLTGLMSAGGAMADHLSIFDKLMGDSQRAMHEAMGRWTSSMGPGAWITEAMRGPAESIAATMRGWSALADGGLWAARLALRMALAAKRAVMRSDIDAVKRFLCDWLDFTIEFVTPDLVNSVSLVLLNERAWLPDDVLALDYDPCPKLRKLTLAEHRSYTRLIIDQRRRANHQSVISLDKSIAAADSDSPATLLDLVAAKPQPALAGDDDISDPRVLRVLAKLTDHERKIAEERGHVGTAWEEAAVACGGTAKEGENLRRKVKRLSKSPGAPAAAAHRRLPDPARGSVSAEAVGR